MSQLISPSKNRPQTSDSPRLVTPSTTPPTSLPAPHDPMAKSFVESRLNQLLSQFDRGTHSFDREDRETPEEKQMSFGEGSHSAPTSRRSSFLSSLTLSRPGFAFSPNPASGDSTPACSSPVTPGYTKEHHLPSGVTMTSSTSPITEPIARPKSTPTIPSPQSSHKDFEMAQAMQMQRSNSVPHPPAQLPGFGFGSFAKGKGSVGAEMWEKPRMMEEKRHFDPSKEPRLLSLM